MMFRSYFPTVMVFFVSVYRKGEGSSQFLQNFMVCRVRGAESNGEGPRFVRQDSAP